VARRGARALGRTEEEYRAQGRDEQVRQPSGRPAPPERWIRADAAGEWADETPRGTGGRGRQASARRHAEEGARRVPFQPKPLPAELASEIRKAAGSATAHHREVLVSKMTDAVAAYDRGRYEEAARLGKQVASEAPAIPAVRELVGLAAYRSGRWREAIRQFDAYGALTDAVDHIPALMDCHRALGKPRKVATLWAELRQQSPEPDVLAEARMVAAGSVADRGDLAGAISLLVGAGAGKALRNPAERHVRQWYALGDLYERAGELPKARELFLRVLQAAPGAFDVADRLTTLGPDRPRRRRRSPAVPRSVKAVADE